MQFEISQIAHVAEYRFKSDVSAHLKRLNPIVRYAHDIFSQHRFPKLDLYCIRLIGYLDAAFANNYDFSSQLGKITWLIDENASAIPLSFRSYKSRRVTRCILSAELLASSDLFDDALSLRLQIEHALSWAVPMLLLKDSKSLFDMISEGSRTWEKRIMLDIHPTGESFQKKDTSNIRFVKSNNNLADCLTKQKM